MERCLAVIVLTAGLTPPSTPAVAQPDAAQVPPGLALGHQALARRGQVPTAGVVVIVPDRAGFIEALEGWTPGLIYPVLIDDGSARAREEIAGFVRGFRPGSVVRRAAAGPLTGERGPLRERIGRAAGRAAGDGPGVPGVVVADERDPAWVAAAALAAGHGQRILWVQGPEERRLSADLDHAAASALVGAIETGLDASGPDWRGLGDGVDAVTLCLTMPAKARLDFGENAREHFAITDLVGRHEALLGPRLRPTGRWAWAGQIGGRDTTCAYRAMCSLFLAPRGAWLFDGYPDSAPWNQHDMTAAGDVLSRAGLPVRVIDTPRNGLDDWLLAVSRPLDQGLALVTTKGRVGDFELAGGRGSWRDVPMLAEPAVVCFTHSWSAARPGDRRSVAGMWFERGAYAYVGSVHEPFLQAFVPTPALVTRLGVGMPLSAAARPDGDSPVWKIATLGDALAVLGRPRPRSDAAPALDGTVPVEGELAAAAAERRFADAVRALVMLGRDAEASELAGAVRADDPASFDADLAEAVALAAFRAADSATLAACVSAMGRERAEASGAADALWMDAEPRLAGVDDPIDGPMAEALLSTLREGTVVRDALRLARAWGSVSGDAARNRVLDAAERLVTDAKDVAALRAARR
jgi:hypothetical protein